MITNTVKQKMITKTVKQKMIANTVNQKMITNTVKQKMITNTVNQKMIANTVNQKMITNTVNQKMITNTVNQKNKMETQSVVYKVKCLGSNSICIGETGGKLIARPDEHKQDANKDHKGNIFRLQSHIKNTGQAIDWENTEIMYREQN